MTTTARSTIHRCAGPSMRCAGASMRCAGLMAAAVLVLAGCQSGGSAAAGTVGSVVGGVVGPAVNLLDAAGDAVTPDRQVDLQEQQRIAMSMRAGPGRFQNPRMTEYRERLQFRQASLRRSPFEAHRQAFRHPAMGQLQSQISRGTAPVDPLPVDPDPGGSLRSRLGMPLVNIVVRQLGLPDPVGLPVALPFLAE